MRDNYYCANIKALHLWIGQRMRSMTLKPTLSGRDLAGRMKTHPAKLFRAMVAKEHTHMSESILFLVSIQDCAGGTFGDWQHPCLRYPWSFLIFWSGKEALYHGFYRTSLSLAAFKLPLWAEKCFGNTLTSLKKITQDIEKTDYFSDSTHLPTEIPIWWLHQPLGLWLTISVSSYSNKHHPFQATMLQASYRILSGMQFMGSSPNHWEPNVAIHLHATVKKAKENNLPGVIQKAVADQKFNQVCTLSTHALSVHQIWLRHCTAWSQWDTNTKWLGFPLPLNQLCYAESCLEANILHGFEWAWSPQGEWKWTTSFWTPTHNWNSISFPLFISFFYYWKWIFFI